MRVGIVCGAGIVSGKEVMALQLGEGLRQAGADVYFITSRWGNGEFGRAAEAAGFPTSRLWLGFISATLRFDCLLMTLDQLRRWPALLLGFSKFLREREPNYLIHTNWQHSLLLWPLLKRNRDVFWLHETLPPTRQYRFLVRLLSKRIKCFVAVSQAPAQSLRHCGLAEDRMRVIWNGIEDPTGDREIAKSREPVIGIVGQVGRWKGHETLIEAFAAVRRSCPEARLEIFGKGTNEYEASLRKRIKEFGVDEHVTWNGFVSDKQKIYPGLRIVVVPSLSDDPLPTSAIEAAFFARPVIGSRRGGLPEIIEDGETGYLFEPGNARDLSRRVVELLAEPVLYERMSLRSRQRAVAHFGRERFVRQFVELLVSSGH